MTSNEPPNFTAAHYHVLSEASLDFTFLPKSGLIEMRVQESEDLEAPAVSFCQVSRIIVMMNYYQNLSYFTLSK